MTQILRHTSSIYWMIVFVSDHEFPRTTLGVNYTNCFFLIFFYAKIHEISEL